MASVKGSKTSKSAKRASKSAPTKKKRRKLAPKIELRTRELFMQLIDEGVCRGLRIATKHTDPPYTLAFLQNVLVDKVVDEVMASFDEMLVF